MKTRISTSIALAVALALAALFATGCGSDSKSGEDGNPTDAAFAANMIDHHRGAIEMAEIALKQADRGEVKELAGTIIAAQRSEISLMTSIREELAADGVKTGSLGMSHTEMGMVMDTSMLARAKPFDRAFLEMMIPHHRGAVAMAKIELDKGSHPDLLKLARAVIDDQTAEIAQMQSWMKQWYGAELPKSTGGSTGGSMDHGAT